MLGSGCLILTKRSYNGSGGYGKFRGGLNLETIAMVCGSKDLAVDFLAGLEGAEIMGFGFNERRIQEKGEKW